MAGTTSLTGLTSDIDWTKIIDGTINAKKAYLVGPLETKKTAFQTKLSAYQSFNSLLLSLKNYIENNKLYEKGGYHLYTHSLTAAGTSVNPTEVVGVSLGDVRGKGSYSIEIITLAQAEKLASDSQSSKTNPLGLAGTITINGKEITINTTDSLSEVASAVNTANAGVTASILTVSETEHRLLLESTTTGVTGISLTDGGDVLKSLGVLDNGGQKKNVVIAGADASLKVEGYLISSTSNQLTDAIEGVTLTLKKTNLGTPVTLSIMEDTSGVAGKVSALVSSINAVLSFIRTQNTYTSEKSPALMGDVNIQTVRNGITSAVYAEAGANETYKNLSSLGVTFGKDGMLSVDTAKLTAAWTANRTEVLTVLVNLGNTLKTSMGTYVDPYTGTLTYVEQSINKNISAVDNKLKEIDARLTKQREQMEQRYAELEVLLAKSNLLKNWLTQQVDYMKKKD